MDNKTIYWIFLLFLCLFSCNGGGDSGLGFSGISPINLPEASTPTNVTVRNGAGAITLSWTQDSNDSYKIYMVEEPGITKSNYLNLIGGRIYTATENSITIDCLTPMKKYYFVVTGRVHGVAFPLISYSDESPESKEVQGTPAIKYPEAPTTPQKFQVVSGVESIFMRWAHNPVADNVEHYNVYLAAEPWDSWHLGLDEAQQYEALVFNPLASPPTLNLTNLDPNQTYWSEVTAVCGGESVASPQLSAQIIKAGKWTEVSSMPEVKLSAVGEVIGDEIYVVGIDTETSLAITNVYNSASNSWYQGEPPILMRTETASAVWNGNLYIAGGIEENETTDKLEVYDINKKTWTILSSAPSKRRRGTMVAFEEYLYFLGGFDENRKANTSLDLYDTVTDTWETTSQLPFATVDISAEVINRYIYIVGAGTSTPFESLFALSIDSLEWEIKAPMPYPKVSVATVVLDNKLYVIGGNQSNGMDIYDPASDSWVSQSKMPQGRSKPIAGAIADKIYVTGGYRSSVINSVIKYTQP